MNSNIRNLHETNFYQVKKTRINAYPMSQPCSRVGWYLGLSYYFDILFFFFVGSIFIWFAESNIACRRLLRARSFLANAPSPTYNIRRLIIVHCAHARQKTIFNFFFAATSIVLGSDNLKQVFQGLADCSPPCSRTQPRTGHSFTHVVSVSILQEIRRHCRYNSINAFFFILENSFERLKRLPSRCW